MSEAIYICKSSSNSNSESEDDWRPKSRQSSKLPKLVIKIKTETEKQPKKHVEPDVIETNNNIEDDEYFCECGESFTDQELFDQHILTHIEGIDKSPVKRSKKRKNNKNMEVASIEPLGWDPSG